MTPIINNSIENTKSEMMEALNPTFCTVKNINKAVIINNIIPTIISQMGQLDLVVLGSDVVAVVVVSVFLVSGVFSDILRDLFMNCFYGQFSFFIL